MTIHKSRKLKRFASCYQRAWEAKYYADCAASRFTARWDGMKARLTSMGFLEVTDQPDAPYVVELDPNQTYALYQLLERAFGKD